VIQKEPHCSDEKMKERCTFADQDFGQCEMVRDHILLYRKMMKNL
jgi:hypothetical protein